MKKIFFTAVALLGVVLTIAFVSGLTNRRNAINQPAQQSSGYTYTEPSKTEKSIDPFSNWIYEEQTDKMDNTVYKFARCSSRTVLNFPFPYDESSFEMVVRQKGKKKDVYVTCTSCQFLTGIMGDKSYRVKFDSAAPVRFTVAGPDSYDSKMFFIVNGESFVKKLKQAKRVMIEPEFHEAGRQAILFNTEGLKL